MSLRVYNTLTKQKDLFEPVRPGKVGIYLCGVTVYKSPHIGHMVGPVIFDAIKRFLTYKGFEVTWVVNITDVEDKLIEAAQKKNASVQELAERYSAEYLQCLGSLGIDTIDRMPKATDHIAEIIGICEKLIATDHAYAVDGNVWFDVSKDPDYGKLSNRKVEEQETTGRVEAAGKRNPADFALWRAKKPGDLQFWDSPWGQGNPGWHIECSAMSMKYLGETFDIHSGGEDNLFPHHESEIAQSEAATGKPFVRYWTHVRFLKVDSGAMHKSAGNAYLLKDLESWGFEPLAFRLLVLNNKYRQPLDFTRAGLGGAQNRLDRWRGIIRDAWQSTGGTPIDVAPEDPRRTAFVGALTDDLNTPAALAQAEAVLDLAATGDVATKRHALEVLFDMDQVLALSLRERASDADLSSEERAALAERDEARKTGDYKRSDELRAELERKYGIRVKDTKDGTRWERIRRKGA